MNPTKQQLDLDCSRLPPAPHLLIQLIDLCHRNDVSFSELEAIISRDSALSAKVIAIANSAAFAQWNETRELKRILVVLGTRAVKSIALSSMVHQFFSQFSRELGEIMGGIWLDALICAHLNRKLAELTDYPYPEEAHLCGLLHQLGQLVLLSNDPKQYQQLIQKASSQEGLLYQEQQQYGLSSSDLASQIVKQWGLDSVMHDAIKYQHMPAELMLDTHPLIKITNLASQLSNRINHGHQRFQVEDHFFGLNQALVNDLIKQATLQAVAEARGFGIHVDENEAIPKANIDDEAIRIKLAQRIRQYALLDSLQQHGSDASELVDIIRLSSENLQLLFGFQQQLVFLPNADYSKLVGFNHHDLKDSAHDLEINLQQVNSLVSLSVSQKKILTSLEQKHFPKLPIVDQQICDQLQAEAFISLPLLSNDEVMGVIVIGCHADLVRRHLHDISMLQNFARLIADMLLRQQRQQHQLKQVQQQTQLESELNARKVTHEINNPLAIINNYLELISLNLDEQSDNREHIDIIKAELDRIGELLLQLKDADDQDEESSQVNINQLIEKLVMLFKPTFYKMNRIENELILAQDMPLIETDPNKLKQIITNIVKNSAEALTDSGTIKIRTRSMVIAGNKKHVEISISDNGPGVPEHVVEHLFAPVKSTKGSHHSGLGLTIVSKLVNELQGRISYCASSSGGAKFSILLPRE